MTRCTRFGPGLTLHHTGGHYEGHSILYDAERRAVFCGDALKIDFDADGTAQRISCHKAYHKQIPLSRGEAQRYREVFAKLDFTAAFTPFECATNIDTKAALALLDDVIEGPPHTGRSRSHDEPARPAAEPARRGAAYVDSMPEGRVELFALTPLDRTGVACWNAIFLNQDGTRWHGVAPHGVGYGVDDASAIIGTTGELAEAVHSAIRSIACRGARRATTRCGPSAARGAWPTR